MKIIQSLEALNRNARITAELFGAVGDGITDDTVAIKKSILYGNSQGVPIYLNSSTYIISDFLDVTCSLVGNNTIIKVKDDSGMVNSSTTTQGVLNVISSDTYVIGIEVDCNGANNTYLEGGITYYGGVTPLGVRIGYSGVIIGTTLKDIVVNNVSVEKCKIRGASWSNINIYGTNAESCDNINIEDNELYSCRSSSVSFHNVKNSKAVKNYVENPIHRGIVAYNDCYNVEIKKNHAKYVEATIFNWSKSGTTLFNFLDGEPKHAISIGHQDYLTTIDEIGVYENRVETIMVEGVQLPYSSCVQWWDIGNIDIQHNDFSGSFPVVYSNPKYSSIKNNKLRGTTTAITSLNQSPSYVDIGVNIDSTVICKHNDLFSDGGTVVGGRDFNIIDDRGTSLYLSFTENTFNMTDTQVAYSFSTNPFTNLVHISRNTYIGSPETHVLATWSSRATWAPNTKIVHDYLGYYNSGVDLTLTGDWTNEVGTIARLYSSESGQIHLAGVIEGGTDENTIVNIPEQFRPIETQFVSVYSADGLGATTLIVNVNGNIVIRGAVGNSRVGLGGVSWQSSRMETSLHQNDI